MTALMTFRNYLYARSKTKTIIVLLLAAQLMNIAMHLFTLPIIQTHSRGVMAFDISSFGYSFENARIFLEGLSPMSRSVYLFIQEPLDVLFPLFSSLFFMLLFVKLTKNKNHLPLIGLLPLIFDYAENILVIIMLLSNDLSRTLVKVSSTVTTIKSVSYLICYFLLIILLFLKGAIFIRSRRPYASEKIQPTRTKSRR